MEPKLNNLTAKPEFPPEPQFHDAKEEKVEVPRIVPADYQVAPPALKAKEEVQIQPSKEKEPDNLPKTSSEGMLSQLSKDLDELSRPLEKKPEESKELQQEVAEPIEPRPAEGIAEPVKAEPPIEPTEPIEAKPPTEETEPIETKPAENTTELVETKPAVVAEPITSEPVTKVAEPIASEPVTEVTEPIVAKAAAEVVEPIKDNPETKEPEPEEPAKIVPRDDEAREYSPADERIFPDYDDLGDHEGPESSHPIFKSFMLLLCLGAIIVGAWQVCLFLQPSFMKSEMFSGISQQSCQFLYCPPLRRLKIEDDELDETGPGQWMASFRLLNPDIRPQQLPRIRLRVDGVGKATTIEKIYEPGEYTVLPSGMFIDSGTTVKVQIPFEFSQGQPSGFVVRVVE